MGNEGLRTIVRQDPVTRRHRLYRLKDVWEEPILEEDGEPMEFVYYLDAWNTAFYMNQLNGVKPPNPTLRGS